ncbi:MAG: hypothetical protein FWE37_00590 [Spirochaetaceae bacterium]|nr:hypothetical protein [Spirochaetaceae bacterium]
MKKLLILIAIGLLSANVVMAQAGFGRGPANNVRGRGPQQALGWQQPQVQLTEVSYQGRIMVSNRRFVEMQTASGTVYLHIPPMFLFDGSIPINDGDVITITGFESVDGGFVSVASITIGNNNYVIPAMGGFGGRGFAAGGCSFGRW